MADKMHILCPAIGVASSSPSSLFVETQIAKHLLAVGHINLRRGPATLLHRQHVQHGRRGGRHVLRAAIASGLFEGLAATAMLVPSSSITGKSA
ncbi:hypothetical protein BBK36DRAFT_1164121 [Trichoderma citrinoviride]|uniref:Uncharacterized protein n=1 Tax=Trichoderma citrinoviride TaxID=58853 RepID=A0A2T4AWD4_9HYPO|nr:hypothetical protein BBK36DRAFT_1164121 [Trichoderma citrinoviride]PTB61361.1 hypothetical protein BBK36DRAFT_1164121 [Trichoderma citrinoviride]